MDQLTASQISEWEAYNKIDPIGSWREDYRIASLSALIENIVTTLYGKKGIKKKVCTPLDYMIDWETGEPLSKGLSTNQDDLNAQLKEWAMMHNRFIKKEKEKNERLNRPPSKLKKK